MKLVKKSEAKSFKNSPVCTAYEYTLGDKDLNAAVIELRGRYPDSGRVVNEECKEIVHIIQGTGKVVIEDVEIDLAAGDQVFIDQHEKYYFEGKMTFVAPCTPAWYPEQHKEVE